MTFLIDGQRKPKAESMPTLTLRSLGPAPKLTGVEVIEVDMAAFEAESEWEATVPMDLTDLKG